MPRTAGARSRHDDAKARSRGHHGGRRPDPECSTCQGTGVFVPVGKAHEVAVDCPRCMGPPSVRSVPVAPLPPPAVLQRRS